jgi:hypothetical protein
VARSNAGLTYDEDWRAAVLFGGFGLSGAGLSDTWRFDGLDWAPVSTTERPPPRGGHVLAYDAVRKRSITVAGAATRASTSADVSEREAWELYRIGHKGCLSDEDCASGICVVPQTARGGNPREIAAMQGVCCDEYCGPCERCNDRGVCQVAAGGPCRGDAGCDGTCSEFGRCQYPGPDRRCGKCLGCNATTGRCDQLPLDVFEPACQQLLCHAGNSQCREYWAQHKCVAPGQCATLWAHCTQWTNKPDGTPCNCFGGQCFDVCSGGFCDRRWGDPP